MQKNVFYIGIILVLIFLFGMPNSFNLMGFEWDLNQPEENKQSYNIDKPSMILAPDLIFINNLKPRQQIYGLNENATVDFYIQCVMKTPYNVSVFWIHDNKTYFEWTIEDKESKNFYSYYTVNSQGVWKTQVVLKWEYLNKSYSKDDITTFEVIQY